MRQWRKQPAIVNQAPPKEAQIDPADQDSKWRELPMPKGSELYPPWSRALLWTARAGLIVKSVSNTGEDEKDNGDDEDAEGELDTGFQVYHWSQIARESEQPEPEYLAKRRKGLATLYGGAGSSAATAALRKTKVRKVDPDGDAYFLDVLVPEGTVIEGEVAEGDNVATQLPAPGTVVEGIGVANAEGIVIASEQVAPTPPRRRPPPPKRKPKGPGRGRKKKVVVENGVNGAPTGVDANTPTKGADTRGLAASGNPDGGAGGVAASPGVGDDSTMQDGEEGSEDEEEEGEEGDDGDREEGELTDTEDLLSRSATPSKPPRSRSVSKVKEESVPSTNAPTGDGTTKSTYLAPPIISISSSVETSSVPSETPSIPVPDSLQPSTAPPPTTEVTAATELDASISPLMPTEDHSSRSDTNEMNTNLPQITNILPPLAPVALIPTEELAQNSSENEADVPMEDADAVLQSVTEIADGTTTFATTTSSILPSPLETTLSPPNLPEQTSTSLSVAALTEPVAVAAPATDPVAPVPAAIAENQNPLDDLSEPRVERQTEEDSIPAIATEPENASGNAETSQLTAESTVASLDASNDEATPLEPATAATGIEDDIFGSLERHLQSQSG